MLITLSHGVTCCEGFGVRCLLAC